MSEITENTGGSGPVPESGPVNDQSRVRFQGIVESDAGGEPAQISEDDFAGFHANRTTKDWNAIGGQIQLASRVTAVFIIFLVIVGWPLGDFAAYLTRFGSADGWSFRASLPEGALLFGFVVSALVFFCGYIASRLMMMMNAAESIASAAQQFLQPDQTAVANVETVGAVVRGQMNAINTGIDDALIRLASVEAMIRRHVEAIETAGAAIETRATGAVDRVADERARLIELTENLNAQADAFATAIAEKAHSSIEALQSAGDLSQEAESNLDERLSRLEDAARNALESFESLRDALISADETVRASAGSIAASSEGAKKASDQIAKLSAAAADAAARNTANISMSSRRAVEETRAAVEEAIEAARREAENAADEAIAFTKKDAARIAEAAHKALDEVKQTTNKASKSASENAEKATRAVEEVNKAARITAEAAEKIHADVARTSDDLQKTAQSAAALTEASARQAETRNEALAKAKSALEAENARLEALIAEQRTRADRLADAIATQTERLSKLAEAQLREQEAAIRLSEAKMSAAPKSVEPSLASPPPPQAPTPTPKTPAPGGRENVLDLRKRGEKPAASPRNRDGNADQGANRRLDQLAEEIGQQKSAKQRSGRPPGVQKDARRRKTDVSWREILDATDEAEPLDLGAAASGPKAPPQKQKKAEPETAIDIIRRLQAFTFDLETRLYGDPPPALLERFERGDRNVFANRLLRLNEADVKRRIRSESGRDRDFEKGIHDFLQGFERLLEDATTSDTADEELEEYLGSPLGRVYLLIGATVGYFA